MAMQYVCDIYNEIPRGDADVTPEEIFSQVLSHHSRLLNARTWGCPCYVLEPKLREGGSKIPRWQPRTCRGQFLCFSQNHASTVGLILNLRSGSIIPQFHVVYDSEFETVTSSTNGQPPSQWADLVMHHRYETPLDEDAKPQLADEWLTPEEIALKQDKQKLRSQPQVSFSDAPPPQSLAPEEIKHLRLNLPPFYLIFLSFLPLSLFLLCILGPKCLWMCLYLLNLNLLILLPLLF